MESILLHMPSLIVKFVVVVDVVAHIYKHTNSSYQGTFVVQLPFYFLSFAFCISYVCFSFVPFVYVLPDFHFVKEKRVASFSLSRKLFFQMQLFPFLFPCIVRRLWDIHGSGTWVDDAKTTPTSIRYKLTHIHTHTHKYTAHRALFPVL